MTPKEAIDFLDSVVSQVNASRIGHAKLVDAVQTLRTYVLVSNSRQKLTVDKKCDGIDKAIKRAADKEKS